MPPKILCTFPGKAGDILWALPTIRAVAETIDAPVSLVIAGAYESLLPLLQQQSYLGEAMADSVWEVQDTAPMSPRIPPTYCGEDQYDHVLHLGYRGWPTLPLPQQTYAEALQQWPDRFPSLVPLGLHRPWIQVRPSIPYPYAVVIGFTDEYFELKCGIVSLLSGHFSSTNISGHDENRWRRESLETPWSWIDAARWIQGATVFLGDCSALHVLACAMGKPVIMVEPQSMRHQSIFYPYGDSGPEVTLVRGNDGQPTWDARHVADALRATLQKLGRG